MNRTIATCALTVLSAASVFACMPAMSSTSEGTTSPERGKWTKHRIETLRHERGSQDAELRRIEKERRSEAAYRLGKGDNVLEGSAEADRRHDAIMRQREINTIELLAIKKERGELTPAGERKLNALIRKVRAEGR